MSKYFDSDILLGRLLKNYYKYGSIVVAFDFDDTVRDYHTLQPIEDVVNLLKVIKARGYAKLVCYTCRSGVGINQQGSDYVKEYLKDYGIEYDAFNEPVIPMKHPVTGEIIPQTGKIYYNIFLDDKAGLGQAFEVLERFVKILDADLG